jgi:hypothetical protein
MAESRTVEVRVVAKSAAELQEFLGAASGLTAGRVTVTGGLVLDDVRVYRSSGAEGTRYVLEAVASAADGVLATWLTEQLRPRPRVTATIDGVEVRDASVPPPG